MRKLFLLALSLTLACGGSSSIVTPPPKKPDPYITVRFQNLMDTTTAAGRADWTIFLNITSADPNQEGFVLVPGISLVDIRLQHLVHCQSVGADSVGQRLVSFIALADTVSGSTSTTRADSIAHAWFAGSHAVPTGWAVLYQAPIDAWNSAQYIAGHGLVPSDPIKWGWDWTNATASTFYERASTDTTACNTF